MGGYCDFAFACHTSAGMFQEAAAVGGGMWLKRTLDDVQWPHLRRAVDPNASFRLSVRVVSASAPGLGSPGILAKQRPFLEVAVGDSSKHRSSGPREDEDLARWSYLQRCRREAALGNSDVHGVGAPVHVSV